jgi:hypothetical protein
MKLYLPAMIAICALCPAANAQSNYEIQVYGADTVASRTTVVEMHSNFTVVGARKIIEGVSPTDRPKHEAIEITHSESALAPRLLPITGY